MKKLLIFILVLMLLPTGCQTQQTVEAETPAPTATPEPTEEPAKEPPYVDARKPYTYIMTDERDRK